MKNKKNIIILLVVLLFIIGGIITFLLMNNKTNNEEPKEETPVEEPIVEEKKKVQIFDMDAHTRPIAVVINNTPVAVKVQEGINNSYILYEFPTEGNTSRLMALYKDVPELTIGTIRSSRHNFIDYALESDCIFVHFGWSKWAKADQQAGSIDYLNGLFGGPFWSDNPENLAVEHTAYTALEKVRDSVKTKEYRTEANDAKDTILLNYNTEDIDLSNRENVRKANKIVIPYGSVQNTTTFVYDADNKMYNRIEDGKNCIDHNTKEQVNTKNKKKKKITHTEGYQNSKYWDLHTIGSGDGFFITNGYAVPIKWSKESRKAKTKYTYLDGKEIEVSDGRTYIELQTTKQNLTIAE